MPGPIRPAAPIRDKYQARLWAEIDAMHRAILRDVSVEWKRNTPETVIMASDNLPAKALQQVLSKQGSRWLKRFDDLSESLAEYFSQAVRGRCDRTLEAMLRKGGMSVRFKMTRTMRDAFAAVRGENVSLIRSIASQHLSRVETLVMQSVSQGRDLASLSRALEREMHVSKRRAALIARDQNNKATATMRSIREREIGVIEGVWMHSGGGREPRPEHKAFSGKRFKLSEGHDFGDGFGPVLPGQAINCRCTWKAVIPGFDT